MCGPQEVTAARLAAGTFGWSDAVVEAAEVGGAPSPAAIAFFAATVKRGRRSRWSQAQELPQRGLCGPVVAQSAWVFLGSEGLAVCSL